MNPNPGDTDSERGLRGSVYERSCLHYLFVCGVAVKSHLCSPPITSLRPSSASSLDVLSIQVTLLPNARFSGKPSQAPNDPPPQATTSNGTSIHHHHHRTRNPTPRLSLRLLRYRIYTYSEARRIPNSNQRLVSPSGRSCSRLYAGLLGVFGGVRRTTG